MAKSKKLPLSRSTASGGTTVVSPTPVYLQNCHALRNRDKPDTEPENSEPRNPGTPEPRNLGRPPHHGGQRRAARPEPAAAGLSQRRGKRAGVRHGQRQVGPARAGPEEGGLPGLRQRQSAAARRVRQLA